LQRQRSDSEVPELPAVHGVPTPPAIVALLQRAALASRFVRNHPARVGATVVAAVVITVVAWRLLAAPAAGAPEAQRPPDDCYERALRFRVMLYQRLSQSLAQLKGCLASGYPFVFGFTVYDSFFEEQGVQKVTIPLPSDSDSVLGGHAVMAVGYDDAKRVFIVRNSWGTDQGDGGYFYMPYSYVTEPSLSGAFWTIRTVSN